MTDDFKNDPFHNVTSCSSDCLKSFPTTNVFLAIPWAKRAFFCFLLPLWADRLRLSVETMSFSTNSSAGLSLCFSLFPFLQFTLFSFLRRVMTKDLQWSMVCGVPRSLRSAPLLQQKYTFCVEDLSFDTIICPRRYRSTFAIVIPQH